MNNFEFKQAKLFPHFKSYMMLVDILKIKTQSWLGLYQKLIIDHPCSCLFYLLPDLLSRIDLDELMKKDEPPFTFPKTLEEFEYAFNEGKCIFLTFRS